MLIKEYSDKLNKLVADARAAMEEISKNTDEARATELEARHDTIMAEYDATEKKLERAKRMAEAEARVAERAEDERGRLRPRGSDATVSGGQPDGDKPSYREVFATWLRAGGDLSELEGEERSVLKAGRQELRVQSTTASAGGYTVPVELDNEIIKTMKMWGPMYDENICTVFTTSSGNQINIPTVDDTAVTAVKHTEGTQLTDDGSKDVTFGQKRLDAYAYDTAWVRFSFELAADSIFSLESLLGSLLGERLGKIANNELTVGDGTGDPNGIVTASSLGKTAVATTAITYDELIDLVHSVDPAYRMSPKIRFMFADLTLAALRKLKDGDGRYIWTNGDVQKGVPSSILGYNYSINQAMPAMTTGLKPIVFGDFGKYFVRKVGSPVIGVVRERFWPDLGIAGVIRFDGELSDTAAVKHLIMA